MFKVGDKVKYKEERLSAAPVGMEHNAIRTVAVIVGYGEIIIHGHGAHNGNTETPIMYKDSRCRHARDVYLEHAETELEIGNNVYDLFKEASKIST